MDYGEDVDAELSSDDEDYKPPQTAESSDDEIDNEDHSDVDERLSEKVKQIGRTAGAKKTRTLDENLTERNTEKEKQRIDDLWSDFLKDTGSETVKDSSGGSKKNETNLEPSQESARTNSDVNEAMKSNDGTSKLIDTRRELEDGTKIDDDESTSSEHNSSAPIKKSIAVKRPKGISSLLGQFSKKQKPTVLEKSQKDWNNFKDNEGINEELKTFNRGRNGFLERNDFLARVDSRQFENEKGERSKSRRY